jgi:hypothetical protein
MGSSITASISSSLRYSDCTSSGCVTAPAARAFASSACSSGFWRRAAANAVLNVNVPPLRCAASAATVFASASSAT